MVANIKRTWKPTTAGILNIIAGVLNILVFTFVIIAIISFYNPNIRQFFPPDFEPPPPGLDPIAIIILIFIIITIAFPIIGGAFALQRRKWGLALAGSIIAAILPAINPLGIASTIFVALSKDEFE